ncbi:MAG: sigma-54-dependent transcriptional regulator, partial [Planctomycetota bacterium JB042]
MTGAVPIRGRAILVVDDELAIRRALKSRFEEEGAAAESAEDIRSAKEKLAKQDFDLIVLDHRLPDGTGLALLEKMAQDGLPAEIIMMTAYSSTEDAIRAMKAGAADYVMKPFDLDEMVVVAERALERRSLKGEVSRLRDKDRAEGSVENLIGESRSMVELREMIERIAGSGARTILIRGESGTGKDLVARAIHYASPEAARPFLNITCTALPEPLLESELFGHEKGAFTDAKQAKMGLFEQADGGTIFLDEVGDMPASLQAKLLRFLESKQFRRVGGLRDISVDVRIVAATNRDLEAAIKEGTFRSDLYYRLNVIPLDVPPLRSRKGDVTLLARHFSERYAEEFRRPPLDLSPAALASLEAHDWPGNVRELKNCIERAVLLGTQPMPTAGTAPGTDAAPTAEKGDAAARPERVLVLPKGGIDLDSLTRDLLDQSLERTGGNKSRAALLLG